jgi:nitric oxide dioxygenase
MTDNAITITARQKELVQSTFQYVLPISHETAQRFYERLFELAPETRDMFNVDMGVQGEKLMQMIAVIVAGLDIVDNLKPPLRSMGARHSRYGVQPHHYELVGQALIYSLEPALGDHFTPEVEEAWWALYHLMADTALSGANTNA